jgi:hypothetical protein
MSEMTIADLLPLMPRRRSYDLNAIIAAAERLSGQALPTPVVIGSKGHAILAGELRIDAARWLDREHVTCLVLGQISATEERCIMEVLAELDQQNDWSFERLLALVHARVARAEAEPLEGFAPFDLDAVIREQLELDDEHLP